MDVEAATDKSALLGLNVSESISLGKTERLVNVTNNFGNSVTVTITLDSASTNDGDLVYGGSNVGDSVTFTLASGETASVEASINPDVTDSKFMFNVDGDLNTISVAVFRDSNIDSTDPDHSIAFVVPGGNLSTLNAATDTVTDFAVPGSQVTGIGRPYDFDGDGFREIPYTDDQNQLLIVDENGNSEVLVGADVVPNATLAVGDYDGDGKPSIFYISSALVGLSQAVKYIEYNGTAQELGTAEAGSSVAGIADFNGDGDTDVVYTDGTKLLYYDGSAVDTGATVDDYRAIGEPADFDGDGTARAPVVKAGEIAFVDANGVVETVSGSGAAPATGALASADWTGDTVPDVVYVNTGDGDVLYYIEPDGTNVRVTDDTGSTIGAERDPGVS